MNLKKQIGLTLLFTAVFSYGSENQVKKEAIECENGTKGFVVSVTNGRIDKKVTYDSCAEGVITVVPVDKEVVRPQESHAVFGGETYLFDKGVGEYKTIDGEQYFFPNGYTEPTVEAGNSCSNGYSSLTTINCWGDAITSFNEGWLNLSKTENSGYLYMHNNPYTNVDNFANLTHAGGKVNFQDSKLENIEGFSNLVTVKSYISLKNTKLTNITGLRNLRYTSGRIYLGNNELLVDISGLNDLTYLGDKLEVDNKEYTVKLAADSYLCQNPTKIVYHGTETVADKSRVCEE